MPVGQQGGLREPAAARAQRPEHVLAGGVERTLLQFAEGPPSTQRVQRGLLRLGAGRRVLAAPPGEPGHLEHISNQPDTAAELQGQAALPHHAPAQTSGDELQTAAGRTQPGQHANPNKQHVTYSLSCIIVPSIHALLKLLYG